MGVSSSVGERAPGFIHAPHDSAMFLSSLVIIPSLARFIETISSTISTTSRPRRTARSA
jgi:hypothetical protein